MEENRDHGSKEVIEKLIASNTIPVAINQLIVLTEKYGDSSLKFEALVISARYNELIRNVRIGSLEYERIDQIRSKILFQMLEILNVLNQ